MGISREAKRAYDRTRYAERHDELLERQRTYRARSTPEQRAARTAYQRAWRAAHAEEQREYLARYRETNPHRSRDYMRESTAKDPVKVKRWRRMRNLRAYGLTIDEYEGMLIRQRGLCAICGHAETRLRAGIPQRLHVDHDHVTGRVRGLLCSRCNRGVGAFRDDPAVFRRAARYLS